MGINIRNFLLSQDKKSKIVVLFHASSAGEFEQLQPILNKMDRSILRTMITKFNGGPVGLESLGVAISEDARTIEEVYEPYLIKEGFIQRTPRGRKALQKSYNHLKINYPEDN